jgi:hypothetical protein
VGDFLTALRTATTSEGISDQDIDLLVRDARTTLARLKDGYESETSTPWPNLRTGELRPLLKTGMNSTADMVVKVWATGSFERPKLQLTKYLLLAHSVAINDPLVYVADFADLPLEPHHIPRIEATLRFAVWLAPLVEAGLVCLVPPDIYTGSLGGRREWWETRPSAGELEILSHEMDEHAEIVSALVGELGQQLRVIDDINQQADLCIPTTGWEPVVRWWLEHAGFEADGRDLRALTQVANVHMQSPMPLASTDLIRIRGAKAFEGWRLLLSELELLTAESDPLRQVEVNEAKRRLADASRELTRGVPVRGLTMTAKEIAVTFGVSLAGIWSVRPAITAVDAVSNTVVAGGVAAAQVAASRAEMARQFLLGRRRRKLSEVVQRHVRAVCTAAT